VDPTKEQHQRTEDISNKQAADLSTSSLSSTEAMRMGNDFLLVNF
jgi:hypothetical protein